MNKQEVTLYVVTLNPGARDYCSSPAQAQEVAEGWASVLGPDVTVEINEIARELTTEEIEHEVWLDWD
jgi:hypothetical protein